jgi:hypothetical protein
MSLNVSRKVLFPIASYFEILYYTIFLKILQSASANKYIVYYSSIKVKTRSIVSFDRKKAI